ncbi:hypothetical protein GCM10028820_05380 [Tessaracoccus terricola]
MTEQKYESFDDLPLGELLPVSALAVQPERYRDYGQGMYCSPCGKNSARRSRADLWMMRREWGDSFQTRFFCDEHLPNEDGSGGSGRNRSRAPEVVCPSCYLRTPQGDECANCGESLGL